MEVFANSEIGKVRSINEDTYYIAEDDIGIDIYIVSDGMGGYNGGEIVDFGTAAAKSYILNNYEITFNNKEDIQKLVNGAIEYANMIVYEKSKEDERYKYMGATLEILLIINDDIYIGHAGDSRIYRLRKDVLKKLTKDHSYIENLIEDGKITREEAVKHPDKNMVTKGIGNSKLVEPDVIHKKFKDGDTILMCTDGLTNMVSEERIKEILKEEGDVSKKLTDEANKNGGMDNITVVVIKK